MTTARESSDAPEVSEGVLARAALGFTEWAERWFPDAYIFAALAVVLVSVAALINGASPQAVAKSFGDGFWTPHHLHHADGFCGHQRLCRRDVAARREAHPRSGVDPWQRASRGRLRRRCQHAGLALELGLQPHFRRSARPGTGAAARSGDGLPRRGRRRLSWPWRDLGAGPQFVRGSAAGQPGKPAQIPDADHRHHPLLRDDLPLAVHGAVRDPDRRLDR